ncbi:MAG: acylphosphatase [Alphaproteobacteria bacterium]|nr:acylphosphatase [Alphaproteobacteria bacterium]
MNEIHILIEGRVQHVGFRRFVLRWAEQLGVSGWVRNNATGSVEVFATGDQRDIIDFINACRKGPLFASVVNVQFMDITQQDRALMSPQSFKVLF